VRDRGLNLPDCSRTAKKYLNENRSRLQRRLEVGSSFSIPDPRPIDRLGLIGAGLMGQAIAVEALKANIPVWLYDIDPDRLAQIGDDLSAQFPADMVHTVSSMNQLADCDLVIESIAERIDLKKQVYEQLIPHLGPDAILATNTSTIPLGSLAAAAHLSDPSWQKRFLGVHFFHPVGQRPLVEIIPTDATSPETVAAAIDFVYRVGKNPLWVGDRAGFVVNRLLHPYLTEAMALLLESVAPERIDQAMCDAGMEKGPLRLADEIGLDTVLDGGRVLFAEFGDRINPSPLLIRLYKSGRWGVKTGSGFYCYDSTCGDEEPAIDEETARQIDFWRGEPKEYDDRMIVERLWGAMLLEGARLLHEQVVESSDEIDLAVWFGLGFPQAEDGLFGWARSDDWSPPKEWSPEMVSLLNRYI
jgi:3-hydroxyacyl-CoA dehydrogenase